MSWGLVRRLSAFALVTMLLLALLPPIAAPELGDVDGNGQINIVDALQIARYDAMLDPVPFFESVGDVNCDSTINIVDALTIARYDAQKITEFPCSSSPPGQPVLISPGVAATVNDPTPTFTWTAGTYAASHRIVVDDSSGFDDGENIYDETIATANEYTPSVGLIEGTYYWKVGAINSQGENWTTARSFTVVVQLPGQPTLTFPSNGSKIADSTPTFTWTAGAYANEHRVRVATDSGFGTANVIDQIVSGVNEYTPSSALSNDNYWWKVTAQNGLGENTSEVWTFEVIAQAPGAPQLTSPADAALLLDATPTLTWTDGTLAESHTLVVDDSANFDDGDNLLSGTVTGGTYTIPSDLASGTYYWKIAATNVVGTTWSTTRSFVIGWPYYREITLSGTQPDDSSIKIDLDVSGWTNKPKADYSDLRFTEDAGTTELDYWVQEYSGDTATVWVERPTDVDDSIFMYYGSPAATSASDGSATFLFFSDGSDAANWSGTASASDASGDLRVQAASGQTVSRSFTGIPSTDVQIGIRFKNASVGAGESAGFIAGNSTSQFYSYVCFPDWESGKETQLTAHDTPNGDWSLCSPMAADTYYRLTINLFTGATHHYLYSDEGSALGNSTAWGIDPYGNPTEFNKLILGDVYGGSTPDIYASWIYIRPYISVEPTPSFGAEQSR